MLSGRKGDGIGSSIDMMRQAVDFRVAVYLVRGERDLLVRQPGGRCE